MQPLKLVVLGPLGCGKTTISNFLADATDVPFEYHPTQGVRILEFEVPHINVNNKHISKDIELWDCSGDHKFKNCWPAIRKDLNGVIFVYNIKSANITKELQQLYDYFINQSGMGPENCVIFCFDPDKATSEASKSVSSLFTKISHVKCNIDDGGNKLKSDFRAFLSTLISRIQTYGDENETAIMNDNILFAK